MAAPAVHLRRRKRSRYLTSVGQKASLISTNRQKPEKFSQTGHHRFPRSRRPSRLSEITFGTSKPIEPGRRDQRRACFIRGALIPLARALSGPVHPRVRGEHADFPHRRNRPVHPRVRGEHRRRARGAAWDSRFIPACAGNTAPDADAIAHAGSSPRARGTRRLTPQRCRCQPVHPRVRGEHCAIRTELRSLPRFIPACAGNTPIDVRCARKTADHPRVRGEHLR